MNDEGHRPIRVAVIDDQPVARSGLRLILAAQPDIEVVGEAEDGYGAVALADRRRPDIILMDVRMPRLDGLEATRRLSETQPHVQVIVITTFDLDDYVFSALRAGAAGFLLKDSEPEQIVDAVRAVADGTSLLSPEVTRRLIERFAEVAPDHREDEAIAQLTPRERDVLLRITRGHSNQQIADDLVLELGTVKGHVGRLLAKLGVTSRVQAVILAYETGLITPGRSLAADDQ